MRINEDQRRYARESCKVVPPSYKLVYNPH
jgi:hypothetical protein